MDCRQSRERIQEQLDGGAPSMELTRHLRDCSDCAAYASRLSSVHELLAEEAEVEWRPELTAGVMRRVRVERSGSRWRFVAAAAMVLFCAWLGTVLLPEIPGFADADKVVSDQLPVPESPGATLAGLEAGFESIAAGAGNLLGGSPEISGIPLAILGLLLILALDGIITSRTLLTRRRKP